MSASASGDDATGQRKGPLPRRPPETYEVPGLGTAKIQGITMGDLRRITEETAGRPDDFSNQVIATILTEPRLTTEEVSKLPEPTVEALAVIAAKHLSVTDRFSRGGKDLRARKRLFEARAAHDAERAKEMLGLIGPMKTQLDSLLAGRDIAASLEAIKGFSSSPAVALAASIQLPDLASAVHIGQLPDLASRMPISLPSFPDIADMVKTFEAHKIPSWAFDQSLVQAGLDNSVIHTPTFKRPAPTPPQPSEGESQRNRLLDAYDSLVQFEFVVREFIRKRLTAIAGPKWWPNRIPTDVIQTCEDQKAEKERPGRPRHHPLFYAYPGDYLKIVERKDNWRECFESVFRNSAAVEACFLWVGAARPEVAHVRPLSDSDFGNFVFAVNWLVRTIREADSKSSGS